MGVGGAGERIILCAYIALHLTTGDSKRSSDNLSLLSFHQSQAQF